MNYIQMLTDKQKDRQINVVRFFNHIIHEVFLMNFSFSECRIDASYS
jgi:hypothetical protein